MIAKKKTSLIVLTLVQLTCSLSNAAPTVYITPGEFGNLFAIHDPVLSRDDCLLPLAHMREAVQNYGYRVQQTSTLAHLSDVHYLIVFDQLPQKELKNLATIDYEKRILFLWEPPTVKPETYVPAYHALFAKIFTWCDDLIDNQRYFKFYYPQPRLSMIDKPTPFEAKKMVTMIARNKYSSHPQQLYDERLRVIRFFEEQYPHLFDLYGSWWDRLKLNTYQGVVRTKADCLSWYRFSVCFENMKDINGYVTEKIFDCFVAGSIPIYWGASNITDYVPSDCFIDYRKFKSPYELVAFLWTIDEHAYQQMIDRIRNYLASDQAAYFSMNHFKQLFVSHFCR